MSIAPKQLWLAKLPKSIEDDADDEEQLVVLIQRYDRKNIDSIEGDGEPGGLRETAAFAPCWTYLTNTGHVNWCVESYLADCGTLVSE